MYYFGKLGDKATSVTFSNPLVLWDFLVGEVGQVRPAVWAAWAASLAQFLCYFTSSVFFWSPMFKSGCVHGFKFYILIIICPVFPSMKNLKIAGLVWSSTLLRNIFYSSVFQNCVPWALWSCLKSFGVKTEGSSMSSTSTRAELFHFYYILGFHMRFL